MPHEDSQEGGITQAPELSHATVAVKSRLPPNLLRDNAMKLYVQLSNVCPIARLFEYVSQNPDQLGLLYRLTPIVAKEALLSTHKAGWGAVTPRWLQSSLLVGAQPLIR